MQDCGRVVTWNERIVRRRDGSYGLHEVYYTSRGKAWAMTEDVVKCSGRRRIVAEAQPIFVEPKRWGK